IKNSISVASILLLILIKIKFFIKYINKFIQKKAMCQNNCFKILFRISSETFFLFLNVLVFYLLGTSSDNRPTLSRFFSLKL
ncbi:hypothetical protein L9F63_002669, partial [Diploptera punctata]